MIDPAFLRDNLETVRTALANRGMDLTSELEELAALESRRRRLLPELEGLKRAVFHEVMAKGEGGQFAHEQVFDHFEIIAPGRLSETEYDGFVRDIVNFLDYVGEPSQVARRSLGVWVVLFLLVFTYLTYLLKKEYWKNVH